MNDLTRYLAQLKPKECTSDKSTCKKKTILNLKSFEIVRDHSQYENIKKVQWWFFMNNKKKFKLYPKTFFIGFTVVANWFYYLYKKKEKKLKKNFEYDLYEQKHESYLEGLTAGRSVESKSLYQDLPKATVEKYLPVIKNLENFKNRNLNKDSCEYKTSLSSIVEVIIKNK